MVIATPAQLDGAVWAIGQAFVEALGAKEFERLPALLDPQIDFKGLTPGRTWEATHSNGVVEEMRFRPDSTRRPRNPTGCSAHFAPRGQRRILVRRAKQGSRIARAETSTSRQMRL